MYKTKDVIGYNPENLRKIIEVLGVSQVEFCRKVGITPQGLNNYLTGRIPSTEVLQKISSAYLVNLNWLLSDEGEMFLTERNKTLSKKQIANRIIKVMNQLKIKKSQLAEILKTDVETIVDLLNGKIDPKQIEAIALALNINHSWLIGGNGIPLPNQPDIMLDKMDNLWEDYYDNDEIGNENAALIDRLDARASAGTGIENFDVEVLERISIPMQMIYPHKPEHVKIIQVIGDSMQNNGGGFLNGDWILFLNDGNVVSDGPYVIVIDEQLFVKQLQFRPKGTILVISINPQYPPIEIKPEEMDGFRIIGRVIGKYRRYG